MRHVENPSSLAINIKHQLQFMDKEKKRSSHSQGRKAIVSIGLIVFMKLFLSNTTIVTYMSIFFDRGNTSSLDIMQPLQRSSLEIHSSWSSLNLVLCPRRRKHISNIA